MQPLPLAEGTTWSLRLQQKQQGRKKGRAGAGTNQALEAGKGVAWALTETSEEGRAKPRESENTEGWHRSTEAQRAPSRLGRESARGKIPPPPDACARALESDTRS